MLDTARGVSEDAFEAINLYKTRIVQQRRVETYQKLDVGSSGAWRDLGDQLQDSPLSMCFASLKPLFLCFPICLLFHVVSIFACLHRFWPEEYGFVQPKIHPCAGVPSPEPASSLKLADDPGVLVCYS